VSELQSVIYSATTLTSLVLEIRNIVEWLEQKIDAFLVEVIEEFLSSRIIFWAK